MSKRISLNIRDKKCDETPEVRKWLTSCEEYFNKVEVEARYIYSSTDSKVIKDTFKGHHRRSLTHCSLFGQGSFMYCDPEGES